MKRHIPFVTQDEARVGAEIEKHLAENLPFAAFVGVQILPSLERSPTLRIFLGYRRIFRSPGVVRTLAASAAQACLTEAGFMKDEESHFHVEIEPRPGFVVEPEGEHRIAQLGDVPRV